MEQFGSFCHHALQIVPKLAPLFEGKETHKGLLEGESIVVVRVFWPLLFWIEPIERCMPDRREQHKSIGISVEDITKTHKNMMQVDC